MVSRIRCLLVVGLLACCEQGDPSAIPTTTSSSSSAVVGSSIVSDDAERSPLLTPPERPTKQPTTFSQAELRRIGFAFERVDDSATLVVGKERSSAFCLTPLPCKKSPSGCLGLQENIDVFKRALPGSEDGRIVSCEWAETGTCGSFRYFDFEGDFDRFELRFFLPDGTLVAQHNWTDYSAFCGGHALSQWQGEIPKCFEMKRAQVLCKTRAKPLFIRAPADDLHFHRTKPGQLGPW
jgi:hypothetical protein